MTVVFLCAATLLASGLTLFSGFGLGTIMTPVFAVFFPMSVAVAMTAIVHFAGNLLKLALFWRDADARTVVRFGLPAMAASFAGAAALLWLTGLAPLAVYELAGRQHQIEPVKLTVALLMAGFSLLEFFPARKGQTVSPRLLPLGGLLSGFFGGLSGHQGAFRGAFLLACGLSKESYVATGVVIACLVDATRLTLYAGLIADQAASGSLSLVAAATLSAFAGVFAGRGLLRKVTIRFVRLTVGVMLLGLALALGSGII
jgi:uncharacterized protein